MQMLLERENSSQFEIRVSGGDCKSRTSLVFARSVPPHPCPLPQGEGASSAAHRQPGPLGVVAARSLVLLSLRERVGMRGSGPWKVQAAGVLQLALGIR